ncbi:MAG: LysR family transcriptional regulator [Chloroflexi bacterium]|nr:LysR family transcriptional regulator [Chloroflexota bacterium]
MDIAWLETFLAVVRHRSFTRAVQDLHCSQPGASRQIQKLERELGVALLERRGKTVYLTPAGEQFQRYAEEALRHYQQVVQELRGKRTALAGELRIVASTTPGEFLVPGLVSQFTERFPQVQPQVFITDSATVVEELAEGRWDVGFVGARLPRRGLRYRTVAEDEVVLAVPAGHPFAARGEVPLVELAGQPFLEREGGSGTLLSVQRALAVRGLGLPPHRTVMVLNTTQAIVSAVESGYGIGWVSSLALDHRSAGRLAGVRLAELRLQRVLSLVYDTRRPLPDVAVAFIRWVQR